MQFLFYLQLITFCTTGSFTTATTPRQERVTDEAAVKKVIGQMFTGMRNGDSSMVKDVFTTDAVLQSISTDANGQTQVRAMPIAAFVKAVGTPHTSVWDEQIFFEKINIDDRLASVWTPYKFYLGDKFSHCGVNSFQLVKIGETWKVVHIIDTRRKTDCR